MSNLFISTSILEDQDVLLHLFMSIFQEIRIEQIMAICNVDLLYQLNYITCIRPENVFVELWWTFTIWMVLEKFAIIFGMCISKQHVTCIYFYTQLFNMSDLGNRRVHFMNVSFFENEYHFILDCSVYRSVRTLFLQSFVVLGLIFTNFLLHIL